MTRLFLAISILFSSVTCATGATDLYRHEATILADNSSQANFTWFVHAAKHYEFQTCALWDTRTGTWKEQNLAAGPVFRWKNARLVIPIGVRFSPVSDWDATHAITKANVFVNKNEWSAHLINDLSWGLSGRPDVHFLQYGGVRTIEGARVGFGPQAEFVIVADEVVSAKFGPIFRVRLASHDDPRAKWLASVDVNPFWDFDQQRAGVKFNFLNFRFGK